MESLDLIFSHALLDDNIKACVQVLDKLDQSDTDIPIIRQKIWDGQTDIRSVLFYLAQNASCYLEIGVRRGMSTAMVGYQSPRCLIWAFDKDEVKEIVLTEMAKVGYSGPINFVIGDSIIYLPELVKMLWDVRFDLILIDGGHSYQEALSDLRCGLSLLGGYLVCDDLQIQAVMAAWKQAKKEFPKFNYAINNNVGIACS